MDVSDDSMIQHTAHSTTKCSYRAAATGPHTREVDETDIKGDANDPVACALDEARTLTVAVAARPAHTIMVGDSYKTGKRLGSPVRSRTIIRNERFGGGRD